MATAAELAVRAEVVDLKQVAAEMDWSVVALDTLSLVVGLRAGDGSKFWVHCDASGYPGTPPAWRWCAEDGTRQEDAALSPKPGKSNFFHANGVICAPWNRLAYKSVNPGGPHGDWDIGNWQANSYTGQTKTLAAMVTRLAIELEMRFDGRIKEAA